MIEHVSAVENAIILNDISYHARIQIIRTQFTLFLQ